MGWALLVLPSLENAIGKMTVPQKPSSRVSSSTLIQFCALVFSLWVHVPDTPSFDSLFSAYNSQIFVNTLEALETQPIQNLHSVFLCQSLLSLRILSRCPDVADCWLAYHF